MKTLKMALTSALLSSVVLSGAAMANDSLSSLIYEESSNIYSESTLQSSQQIGIISYADDSNSSSVWSAEYEQYVNPADFTQGSIASLDDVNQYVGSNPTAAGRMKGRETFIYNETAGEYHLQ